MSEGELRDQVLDDRDLLHLIDIELLFIWPWAMLYRQLGWFGFVEMLVFLGILMLGFAYIWRKGASNGSRRLLHAQARRGHRLGAEVLHLPVPVRDGVLRHGVHGDGVLALRHRPLRRRAAAVLARQADVLFVVGTISHKMAPVLKRIYDQMTEPKWVVAFGVCTCTGGFYDNYATVQGIDTIIPVDVYIPGCPPRPESVIDGLMKLQDKIAAQVQRY